MFFNFFLYKPDKFLDKSDQYWIYLEFLHFAVERAVNEEFSSSSKDRLRTYTYHKGNGTKKSHSLPG